MPLAWGSCIIAFLPCALISFLSRLFDAVTYLKYNTQRCRGFEQNVLVPVGRNNVVLSNTKILQIPRIP